mmetsp:Transcript_17986/g.39655  ORF Transcript_17986/g.39655 Transcript_17986/m.39655 type:complete len:235 (-) Transcript_17986:11-715(-)
MHRRPRKKYNNGRSVVLPRWHCQARHAHKPSGSGEKRTPAPARSCTSTAEQASHCSSTAQEAVSPHEPTHCSSSAHDAISQSLRLRRQSQSPRSLQLGRQLVAQRGIRLRPVADPDPAHLGVEPWVKQHVSDAADEAVAARGVKAAPARARLCKVVLLGDDALGARAVDDGRRRRRLFRVARWVKAAGEVVDLLVAVHPVQRALVVVVVVGTLWRVDRQHQVVGAEPVALRVGV